MFLKFRGLSKLSFYKATGLSNGFLDKDAEITEASLRKIANAYHDLNITWVRTGEGEMLCGETNPGADLPKVGRRTDVWVGTDNRVYWTMNTGNERLKQAFEWLKKEGIVRNQAHFGQLIGESSSGNLSNYLTGKKAIGEEVIQRFAVNLEQKLPMLSATWLRTGEGEMLRGETNPGAGLPDVGRRTDVWVGTDNRVYWTEALQVGHEEDLQRAQSEGVRLIPEVEEMNNNQLLSTLYKRLRDEKLVSSQAHFGRLIGENHEGNLSEYIKGKKSLGKKIDEYILSLESKMPMLSSTWLRTGEGEMLRGENYDTAFEEFIHANNLKKGELASFLGVSSAFITQLVQGTRKLPESKLALIKARDEWDYSMLSNPGASLPDVGRRTDVWVGTDNRVYWTEALQVGHEEDLQRAQSEGVRLIPEYAEAFRGGNQGETDELQTVDTYWGIPNLEGEMIVPIHGNSMSPKFPAGCRVALKRYPFSPANPLGIQFGEVYAVAVRQGDGYPPLHFIKRLHRHPDKAKERTTYIARSINPDYDDFEVSVSDICHLSAVVARIEVEPLFSF